MEPHQYVFVLLLVALSRITGIVPLWLAQPSIAVIGTIPALIALLLVRVIGTEISWSSHRTFVAATLAGVILAAEGLYLRRSVAVSYEVLGLLFFPAVVLCMHRFFESSRRSWLGAAGLMLLALPFTHHFSTMMTAVTLTVLIGIWIARQPTRVVLSTGSTIIFGFWVYLVSYYSQFTPSSANRVTTNPALFLAWIIAIIALAHCFERPDPPLVGERSAVSALLASASSLSMRSGRSFPAYRQLPRCCSHSLPR